MKFGAFIPQGWRHDLAGIETSEHWPTMLSLAQRVEQLGYTSLWVYDHFHTVPEPTQEVTYEAWTLMSAFAATTETIRLGQMCTCNTYRPPSYLAKVAASIDVISGGRLEMGIGAGWYEHEHDGYGYQFLSAAKRLGMLREGVEIMKGMWTEDEFDYTGEYYTLRGAICRPKPAQDPHIPIWVAGGGEQITLRIAARHASHTNFGVTLDEFAHKSKILEAHCEEEGTDYDSIVRSSNFNIMCAETEHQADEKISWLVGHLGNYVSPEKAERTAALYTDMSGTPEQVVESLQEWEKAGCAYAIIHFPDAAYDGSSIELFAREVIPALA